MLRSATIFAALAFLPVAASVASAGPPPAPWTPDPADTCNRAGTTVEIMDCLDGRTKVWDARLDQAYKVLTAMLKAEPNPTNSPT